MTTKAKTEAPKTTNFKPKTTKPQTVVFEHDNKYLWVAEKGIQFREGRYETSDKDEIEFLRVKVTGVREVK